VKKIKIVESMAIINQMTKAFQAVLKKIGLLNNFLLPTYGCHISDKKFG
jgi:hypothetical protein